MIFIYEITSLKRYTRQVKSSANLKNMKLTTQKNTYLGSDVAHDAS